MPRNVISASVYFKDDTHRSVDIYPGVSPFLKVYPQQRLRDQQVSLGFQDVISLTPLLHLTFGFRADHLKGLFISGCNSDNTKLIPLTCLASPANSSFSGCAAHADVWLVWNVDGKRLTGKEAPLRLVVSTDRAPDRCIYGIAGMTLLDGTKLADQLAAKK